MINYGYALGVLVIQMGISFAYKWLGFSHALEILALLYLLNAMGFTVHSCSKRTSPYLKHKPNESEFERRPVTSAEDEDFSDCSDSKQ